MGTGKTTVGQLLSSQLRREFVETDDLIEEKEGISISDIFSKKGEAHFRKVEKEVLKEVAQLDNLIVSCGGGIVIDSENLSILKETGIIVCLEANPSTIYERTKKYTHRPLLSVSNPIKKIKELIKMRECYYRKAHFFVDTSRLTPKEVTDKIVAILKEADDRESKKKPDC